MNLNWGEWLKGLASACASAIVTILLVLIALPTPPHGWQLFVIAIGPFAVNFFSYIKQSPPPIGTKP
jgi:hypothetical protein